MIRQPRTCIGDSTLFLLTVRNIAGSRMCSNSDYETAYVLNSIFAAEYGLHKY